MSNDEIQREQTEQNQKPIVATRLCDIPRSVGDDPNELLRYRYLCREGSLLFVAPSGIGKSSWEMQAAMSWSQGKPFFGIQPARPLKSLIIQAENDDGDTAEMRDGVTEGVGINPAECNVDVYQETISTGRMFLERVVRPLLLAHKPDLLWIDPANSYIGGNVKEQDIVGGFLRNGLNPLLREFRCGSIVVHHTNKPPTGREKSDWQAGDLAYLGSGSTEWANWARAVLAIRSVGSHDVFELVAAKRGGRLGWKLPDGQKTYHRWIAHAKEPGIICWREAEESEITASKAKPKTATIQSTIDNVMAHVPVDGPILKSTLLNRCQEAGIGLNKARAFIDEAVHEGKLFEWKTKRSGLRDAVQLARKAQESAKDSDAQDAGDSAK